MTDYTELKRLAEAAQYENCEFQHELVAATKAFFVGCIPEQILALIAENDSVRKHWQNESNNVQELVTEVLRLKAEVAGLKTGYEAYERVNAELKAEVGVFRGLLGEMRAIGNHAPAELTLRIDAAMGKGEQS